MSATQKINKTGRLLIVLARLGQILTLLFWLAALYFLFRAVDPSLSKVVELMLNTYGVLALAIVNGWLLLQTAVFVWALERIRFIGIALMRHAPISAEVADAVRRSARALLFCGFSTLLQFDLAWNGRSAVSRTAFSPTWEFNWMAFYAVILLCVCVLAIARILHAAVELKAENEGFV